MGECNKKYRPSNGTEGMGFEAHFCLQCIHERWAHTQKDGDKQCDIWNRVYQHDVNHPEYPEEWTYDEKGKPTCTAWKKWDWGRDDDDNGLNEPPELPPDDPNQLCFPFLFDEMGITKEPEYLYAE